jgi:hypothetical protein
MPLLDLPTEIFQSIIESFAEVDDLDEVFLARGVCRAFAAELKYQLLANVYLDRYRDFCKSTGIWLRHTSGPGRFIIDNAEAHLLYHCQRPRGCNAFVLSHINKLVALLLRFAPAESDLDELQRQYTRDTAHAFVTSNQQLRQLLVPIPVKEWSYGARQREVRRQAEVDLELYLQNEHPNLTQDLSNRIFFFRSIPSLSRMPTISLCV